VACCQGTVQALDWKAWRKPCKAVACNSATNQTGYVSPVYLSPLCSSSISAGKQLRMLRACSRSCEVSRCETLGFHGGESSTAMTYDSM
jgi:hypothetical protein